MSHWHSWASRPSWPRRSCLDTLPFAIGMGFVALMGLGLPADRKRTQPAHHGLAERPQGTQGNVSFLVFTHGPGAARREYGRK